MAVKILIISCGSVASVKLPEIFQHLEKHADVEIKLVATDKAMQFLQYPNNLEFTVPLLTDHDEQSWIRKGDPILHIELRKWADLAVLLPLSANTMAKLAMGIADNLATAIMRAWPFAEGKIAKPVLLFPAMNTAMWEHPVTYEHVRTLRHWGYNIVGPVEKTLACGETGIGGLPTPEACVEAILEIVSAHDIKC